MTKKLILTTLALVLLSRTAAAQVESTTRPRRGMLVAPTASAAPATLDPRITAFVALMKQGDEAAIKKYVLETFSSEALKRRPAGPRVERLKGLAADGPLELVRPLPPGPDGPRALVRSKRVGDLELIIQTDALGIVAIQLEPAGPGSESDAVETPKASDQEVAAAADAFVSQLAESQAFSGTVLIAREGKPFFQKAYGLANEDFGVPNKLDTRFNIGSINKVFTEIAIAQLAQSGKLALDDTVSKLLPDLHIPSADQITVRQLLTMTSGLGDFFGEKYQATPKESFRKLADYVPMFVDQPLRFAPGKGNDYSNAGFVVLGLIVERLSGIDYADYVTQHVFTPAGMADTGLFEQDAVSKNRATGYTKRVGPGRRTNIYTLPARASSAGGGYSTAGDLLRLDVALRTDKLLSPEWSEWVLGDKSANPPAHATPGHRLGAFGFAGGSPGVNGVVEMDLVNGTTVIVLSNLDPPSAESVGRRIRMWLPRR